MTATCFLQAGVPFHLVVEPQEVEDYRRAYPGASVLALPESGRGLVYSRNWIHDHAIASGAERHWQIDDNILGFWRRWKARKIRCHAGLALSACETFTERYSNVGLSGLNYYMFAVNKAKQPPFVRNVHVYSCTLVNHAMPYRYRGFYNEDVDLCLQVLSGGWCTILLNAFLAWKSTTMQVSGGQTDSVYRGDGRLKMARALERAWPGVVSTQRRFQRPQHVVKGSWRGFDTPLLLKPEVDLSALPAVDEMGMTLVQRKEVKSESIRALVEAHRG
jgi:hypothetical protein